MNRFARFVCLSVLCLAFASHPALAEKPSWAGGGNEGKQEKKEKHGKQGKNEQHGESGTSVSLHFDSNTRYAIHDYYGSQARAGKCPPGLAKKQNGCQPPGQAKKWAKGQPLPAGLGYNNLPPDLLRRLPPPPPQHRYVQIAGDVLLIAVGSSMVIDAVEDILR